MAYVIPFSQFFTDKDTNTEINHIGDYSITPRVIHITAPAGYIMQPRQLFIVIEGGGAISADDYGSLAKLTNGVKLHVVDAQNNIITDVTSQMPIRNNADYLRYAQSTSVLDFGNGNDFFKVYQDFDFNLDFDEGTSFTFILNDNFSGLPSHTFFLNGRYVKKTKANFQQLDQFNR